ncbi:cobalt-precorrin-6A reductase [Dactylosporangium matsuzakiense]|uniref:Precorrin-6A reductase n=1 Tax=Dactylosporangium matsuzakiense TaxID=53360 RepID=A0A9W6NIU4_9ACTN|nr:cobalt-precorrin-6A reductase [Dactylosporangium matsuzakiense]GLK98315.1 precorrin-6A reductase [Dactylosporangium matsuzakiense]
MPSVLILGGTGEARRLASVPLPGYRVISSLAGRVADPALPAGEVRVGGFGGPAGLAQYLRDERIDVVVDATHPFAAQMSGNAAAACACTGTRLVVLRRPGYDLDPSWPRVDSLEQAAGLLPALGERAFITTGRQGIGHFRDLAIFCLVRCVEPPEPLPANFTVLLDRGPFTVEGEIRLLRRHRIDVLVTKDSGGAMTEAKLEAARSLGIAVVVVDRPPVTPGVPILSTVDEVARLLLT